MTLLEVISDLERLDQEATIYAKQPWAPDCEAVVAREPGAGGIPTDARQDGFCYFLEVSIAREFVEDWMNNLQSSATSLERCERIIRYAIDDA